MLVNGSSRSSRTSSSWYALCSSPSSKRTPAANAATRDTTKTATIITTGVERASPQCRRAHLDATGVTRSTVGTPGCYRLRPSPISHGLTARVPTDTACHDVASHRGAATMSHGYPSRVAAAPRGPICVARQHRCDARASWPQASRPGHRPAAALAPARPAHPHRVLIVSVPTLTWTDLDGGDAPNLSRFLDSAAIADLATRADRQPAKLGAAYVTIGAGTRAAGDETTDGEGLASDERFGSGNAGAAYQQRTGAPPRGGIVDLGIARIDGANASLLYEAPPRCARRRAHHRRLRPLGGDERRRYTARRSRRRRPRLLPIGRRCAHGQLRSGAARGRRVAQLLQRDASAPYGERFDSTRRRTCLPGGLEGTIGQPGRGVRSRARRSRYSAIATTVGNVQLRRACHQAQRPTVREAAPTRRPVT